MNSKNAKPGPDNLPMFLFKNNVEFLSPVITHLCNLSIHTGTFPELHKIGNILPLHKNKDVDDILNYRPICMLNALSKILEKIVSIRLIDHLENNQILSNSQYAYRKARGTDLALCNLVKNILHNFDSNKLTLAVFFRFNKSLRLCRSQNIS